MNKAQSVRSQTVPQGSLQKVKLFHKCWYYFQGMLTAIVILAVGVVFVWVWQMTHNPALFPFRHITFIGQFSRISKPDLEKVAQMKLNGGFFMLKVSDMRQAIQLIPWVDQVEIQKVWPDVLKIKVTEQQPVARWGESKLINNHLQIFTPPTSSIPQNLPMLFGPEKYVSLVTHNYMQIQNQLKIINLSIAALRVNDRMSWRMTLNNGIEVILGQEEILKRCNRLVSLYPRIIRARAEDVARIDLRYPNGLAVKWKPETTSLNSTAAEKKTTKLL